jgi:hypothetical protein
MKIAKLSLLFLFCCTGCDVSNKKVLGKCGTPSEALVQKILVDLAEGQVTKISDAYFAVSDRLEFPEEYPIFVGFKTSDDRKPIWLSFDREGQSIIMSANSDAEDISGVRQVRASRLGSQISNVGYGKVVDCLRVAN